MNQMLKHTDEIKKYLNILWLLYSLTEKDFPDSMVWSTVTMIFLKIEKGFDCNF